MPLIIIACIWRFYLEIFTVLHGDFCPVHLCFTDKKMEAQPVRAGFAPAPEDECSGRHVFEPAYFVFPPQGQCSSDEMPLEVTRHQQDSHPCFPAGGGQRGRCHLRLYLSIPGCSQAMGLQNCSELQMKGNPTFCFGALHHGVTSLLSSRLIFIYLLFLFTDALI